MSGPAAGGAKAAEKNRAKHGPDFYKRIGALGGRAGKTGKFAFAKVGPDGMTGRQRALVAGAVGGRLSKRPSKKGAIES